MVERAAACFEIAPQALAVIRETRDNTTRWKGRADPLCAADEASEEFIVAAIRKRFPADEIICEDAPKYPGTSGYSWVCDPLDGTLNFIRGAAPWGVSIGLMKGEEIIAGCVVEGKSGDVFTAELHGGAKRNGQPIRVSTVERLDRSLAAFDCPYDMDARMRTTADTVRNLLEVSAALRCYGTCAVTLCLIAAGEVDVYAVEYGKPWDFTAGTLLVREACGRVTTWAGGVYHPQRNLQLLATNSLLHDAAAKVTAPFAIA